MSIHIWKSREKAARMGGMAGDVAAKDLWYLSKRELVEIALRLADRIDGAGVNVEAAVKVVNEELAALRGQGIL